MRQYLKPPIVEAVIGITFADKADDELIKKLGVRFRNDYVHSIPVANNHLQLNVDFDRPGSSPTQTFTVESGLRFTSSDASQILVLLPNSFTVAHTALYPGWDVFFERFKRDWAKLKFTMGSRQLTRIGVRFINRLDLPIEGEVVEHEQYLNIYPATPAGIPPLNQYSVQFEINLEELEAKLILNSGPIPAPLLNFCSFLLDIDIVRDKNVPQSDEAIFSYLEQVRLAKNKFFEGSVTDRARKLFDYVG